MRWGSRQAEKYLRCAYIITSTQLDHKPYTFKILLIKHPAANITYITFLLFTVLLFSIYLFSIYLFICFVFFLLDEMGE